MHLSDIPGWVYLLLIVIAALGWQLTNEIRRIGSNLEGRMDRRFDSLGEWLSERLKRPPQDR